MLKSLVFEFGKYAVALSITVNATRDLKAYFNEEELRDFTLLIK